MKNVYKVNFINKIINKEFLHTLVNFNLERNNNQHVVQIIGIIFIYLESQVVFLIFSI